MAQRQNKNLALQFDSNGKPIAGVGPGVGRKFVQAYFPEAEQTIRIASAFFTLKGYKQSQKYISPEVQVQVLVGKDEGVHVRETVIHEIMADLGQCETNLWEAVFDLVARMKNGRFIIRDAREMQTPFHCKFYISDDKLVWHGSTNYSGRGLNVSAEQASISRDVDQTRLFSQWYDDTAKDAKDLVDELILLLEAWLDLATPFQVYLKTLLLLNDLPDYNVRLEAHPPAYYQKGVIARALRQAEEYGGALIVVATGLGKTVIGSEIPMRLQETNKNQRVVLIAPQGVHEHWEKQLDGRNVHANFFSIEALFRQPSNKSHYSTAQLDKKLSQSDDAMIIIVDEVHFYRNQLLSEHSKDHKSMVYKRLVPAVEKGAKIFLFTATAYGTNFQNLNSLLYLLPHRKPNLIDDHNPWQADSADDFSRLPMVTTLGLPHVLKMARSRGDVDENGRTFVLFSDQRRYLPKSLKLHSLRYELFLQSEILSAFDDKVFDQQFRSPQPWFDDDTLSVQQTTVDSVYNAALSAWLSSPSATQDVVMRNLAMQELHEATPQLSFLGQDAVERDSQQTRPQADPKVTWRQHTDTPMYKPLEQRKRVLEPLLKHIEDATDGDDEKLVKLIGILKERCVDTKGKAIIFVGRYFTALYLQQALGSAFGKSIKIGCTVESGESSPKLKASHIRLEERKRFSPRSHGHVTEFEYDLLICTDADGVGHNLQDADTVINYDPPSGADMLFQRAGRVLRMTPDSDRVVHFYTLVPLVVTEENAPSRVQSDIKTIFLRMTQRHDKSSRILGSGVLSEEEEVEISLDSELDIEELTRDNEFLCDIGGLGAASMLSHTAVLEQHREQAEQLPICLMSARVYPHSKHRIFVLVLHEKIYHAIMFDLLKREIEQRDDIAILDMIACTESEPRAPVNPANVERLATRAVQLWCLRENILLDEVVKVCALHLVPEGEVSGVEDILREIKGEEEQEE